MYKILHRWLYSCGEEVVESVYTVLTESTCESDGLGKYTATFTNSAFTAQTHDEVIAGGHNFEFDSCLFLI